VSHFSAASPTNLSAQLSAWTSYEAAIFLTSLMTGEADSFDFSVSKSNKLAFLTPIGVPSLTGSPDLPPDGGFTMPEKSLHTL
jgi:hypothetical protein